MIRCPENLNFLGDLLDLRGLVRSQRGQHPTQQEKARPQQGVELHACECGRGEVGDAIGFQQVARQGLKTGLQPSQPHNKCVDPLRIRGMGWTGYAPFEVEGRLLREASFVRIVPAKQAATHTAPDQVLPSRESGIDAASRSCPKCGNPMVLRTAKSGSRAGNRFWGCSNFPKCRAVVGD
jgi:predicted RNA-binding Zn-ribbon protein involved in translation (DUF1610 family)